MTAPLLTRGALLASCLRDKYSQYGLLGSVLGVQYVLAALGNDFMLIRPSYKDRMSRPEDPRLYMNTVRGSFSKI